MAEIRCIILEDEPLAVKILTGYIAEVPSLQLQGVFKDAILASEFLHDHQIDLIFLDIHLPKLKGISFLRTLAHPPAVIITTAYHQYAVEGFELNVTDYLLKPFDLERFLAAVNKAKTAKQVQGSSTGKDFIVIQADKKKVKIFFTDIIYIESQREYIKIVTTKKTYTAQMATHEVEALLPGERFKRIHRSYIISLDKLESYTAEMVQVGGIEIPIGRAYRGVIDKG